MTLEEMVHVAETVKKLGSRYAADRLSRAA
jgi:hypothetical protein